MPQNYFCDGKNDCKDGSDEFSEDSNAQGKRCRRDKYICILPIAEKEENFCLKDTSCSSDEFTCADRSGCLPASGFCDGHQECKDGSDEIRLRGQLTEGLNICQGHRRFSNDPLTCVAPEKYKNCSREPPCLTDSKDFLDDRCFRCLRYPYIVIPIAKLCDGSADCPDFSDECMCKATKKPEICKRVIWGDYSAHNDDQNFTCTRGEDSPIISQQQLCDTIHDCDSDEDEKDCSEDVYDELATGATFRTKNPYSCRFDTNEISATRCDGKPECEFDVYAEECDPQCSDQPNFCNFTIDSMEWSFLSCNTTEQWDNQYRKGMVYGTSICDGIEHCKDGRDELYCSDRTHFYCSGGEPTYIPSRQRCNQHIDCLDQSDELHYSFKCMKNGSVKFVRWDQVCDGTQNCEDGEDECEPQCINSTFSDSSSLLKNKGDLGGLLFMSSFALFANGCVILLTIRELVKAKKGPYLRADKKQRQMKKVNQVLILSLSISDFIVAVYTFAICIESLITDGSYCLTDRDWRSGATCSALGVFLVIGSEQSVFTMMLITATRVFGTRRPFAEVPTKVFWMALGLSWIISIMLATIPLFPNLEDTFITSIWYGNNKLFTTITQNNVTDITRWLLLMNRSSSTISDAGTIGSWSTLENLIQKLNSSLKVGRKYGFYSSNSVCIPNLFPDKVNNESWRYSLFVVIVNFLAFLVILLGCISLYRAAMKGKKIRNKEKQSKFATKMQTKLTIIVLTDFICWMPVCVMAFCQLAGLTISNDWKIAVGLIILPINSAVNPIIYSTLPDKCWEKIKPLFTCLRNSCIAPAVRSIQGLCCETADCNVQDAGEIDEIPELENIELYVIAVGNEDCDAVDFTDEIQGESSA